MPTDMPDMSGAARRRGGFGTVGAVTAVSGSGFTVAAMGRPTDGSTDSTTTDVTVTVDGSTTYTKTADADADAVKVGVCVAAQGDSDSTGAVTATSISVTDAVDGECTGGFGAGRGPGGGA